MCLGQDRGQCLLGFMGCAGSEQSQEVGDTMDMGIHADGILLEGFTQDEVGGLSTHPRQCEQGVHGIRDLSVVVCLKHISGGHNVFGFCFVEADRVDQISNLLFGQLAQLLNCGGLCKQTVTRLGCGLVFGACREDGTDQNLKRRIVLAGNQGDDRDITI